ncbi:MAG TPA: hypothetical protein VFK40_00680, partial [Nitrososphaeraceae archaeon]|nr:hypothetical protein [Nitrososphaeraceae archaeon]
YILLYNLKIVHTYMSTKEAKINENKQDINERNTTKLNKDNNNFNERVVNTLNQQQNAINKTFDNTLHDVKRSTAEARQEIPQYTQRIAEYIQTVRDIASDVIEGQKQAVNSLQSQQVDRSGVWNWYNPQRIAENYSVAVNNFTNYLVNTANLVNNALASNMRIYNTALEQTRDNLKTFTKTNTSFIQTVSANNQNRDVNTSSYNNNIK